MAVKNITAGQRISAEKLDRAKQFCRKMTPTEGLLWQQLRGNKLGVHFRRQQIIAGFIVDFYCHAAALVVELDGGVHLQPKQAQTDLLRDEGLRQLGLRVVRFKNAEVTTRLPEVLDQIRVLRGA